MSSYLGVCPKCKDDNILLSKPRGSEFVLLKLLPISVYRCQNCHHRFKKMSKLTTYIGNLAYLLIFGLVVYVVFSQYKLNEGDNYLSNANESSVKSVELDSAFNQKEITTSVSDAISLEEQLLNSSVESIQSTSAQAQQISSSPEKKPMPVQQVKPTSTGNERQEKIEKARLAKVEANLASSINAKQTAVLQSSKPITNSASVNKQDEVLLALASWRSAWQDQDVARYLASYSRTMTLEGATFAKWATKRKKRITKPQWIRVEINDPKVQILSSTKAGMPQARAVFQQIYRASNFSDSSQKELLFRKEGGNWNIVKETSL